jgi:hypothetical protein
MSFIFPYFVGCFELHEFPASLPQRVRESVSHRLASRALSSLVWLVVHVFPTREQNALFYVICAVVCSIMFIVFLIDRMSERGSVFIFKAPNISTEVPYVSNLGEGNFLCILHLLCPSTKNKDSSQK